VQKAREEEGWALRLTPLLRAPLARGALAVCAGALAFAPTPAAALGPEGGLDSRAWEIASPLDKNGGDVAPGAGKGAGILQAASGGGAIAFGSSASFGQAQGAAPISQYLASRTLSGWFSQNLTPAQLSGTYGGGAYQLFSADLSKAILDNGWSCRNGSSKCDAENPPLGPGAPAGYRNLYLRQGSSYTPLITTANAPALPLDPADFSLTLQGATDDLRHAVISLESGLYEWSGGQLTLIDAASGAALAAPSGAISSDGSRIYFSRGGNLYLREGNTTLQVDESIGGGGSFETASSDGSVAFFSNAEHLYRFDVQDKAATDLTPAGGVVGVLGASVDGTYLYYLSAEGLSLWHAGTTTSVAAAADASNYPPSTGSARVSPDGTRLAFVSSASLTGYANVGNSEVFLYQAPSGPLLCASCNPKGSTPLGPASIPRALPAGEGPSAYKPRALSEDGKRLFFDTADRLLANDTDGRPDVYEWESQGQGSCAKALGCLGLISGGRAGEAHFADASSDGTDVYFLTEASLLLSDTGSVDLYDARIGGGFAEAPTPLPCLGDDCQGPAPGPDDPPPATYLQGPPNSAPRFAKGRPTEKAHKKKHKKHRHKRHTTKRRGHR
jgi:Tol biopolymer transport system component